MNGEGGIEQNAGRIDQSGRVDKKIDPINII
jgi:hypothetical protein